MENKNRCSRFQLKTKGTDTTMIHMSDDVPVIQFKKFNQLPNIAHGFSTKAGGVSEGPFESMNLSFTRGDDDKKVMENFKRFGQAIGVTCEQMVFTDQTHTTNLRIVTKEDLGKGILRDRDYHDIDGLVTDCKDICLVTFYADCVPLFFVDSVQGVIALSHSGWRGTVGKIGQKTVETMCETFGCKPENIYAAIGPSICQDCYEVSEDVAVEFKQVFPENQHSEILIDKGNGKYLLDLWKANTLILKGAGILEEHLDVTDICTCCNYDKMWSHRKIGNTRGSLAGFLMQK